MAICRAHSVDTVAGVKNATATGTNYLGESFRKAYRHQPFRARETSPPRIDQCSLHSGLRIVLPARANPASEARDRAESAEAMAPRNQRSLNKRKNRL